MIVKKIMDEDKKVSLGEAVDMASWTDNTNVNVLGFQPLQLVTGKCDNSRVDNGRYGDRFDL